jgi:Uma2 family endonuclease
MTTEELLALPPDETVERELIRGVLRERPMTKRNRRHSRTESKVVAILDRWLLQQPTPRGEILSGEAGFRIRRNPDTTVGIDVAYISPEVAQSQPDDARVIDAPPVLAVEILSPTDKQEEILDKVADYLAAGVQAVWVLEPVFRTAGVYRANQPPLMLNETQELDASAYLQGFRCRVADLF